MRTVPPASGQEAPGSSEHFLRLLSHELRTPLTAIRGAAGLLASGALGPLSPSAERMAAIAAQGAANLETLIQQLLELGQPPGPLVPEPLEARLLLSSAAARLASAARARQVRVEIAEGGLDEALLGDAESLVRALEHGLSNAIKFSPRGATVTLAAVRARGAHQLRIADQGPGVGAADVERLFAPFVQGDVSDARLQGGLGLGLTLARAIAEAHGGQVSLEPGPAGGSVFVLALPRRSGRHKS